MDAKRYRMLSCMFFKKITSLEFILNKNKRERKELSIDEGEIKSVLNDEDENTHFQTTLIVEEFTTSGPSLWENQKKVL